MERTKSCRSRLQEIRKELGISKKDYGKGSNRSIHDPLPEIHIKADKKTKKKEKKRKKKQRYMLADWYLNKYLKPKYAQQIFEAFDDFEEMVDYACTMANEYLQVFTYSKKDRKTWDEWAEEKAKLIYTEETRRKDYPLGADMNGGIGRPVVYLDENADIPEFYWDAFDEYCEKHPIKKHRDISERRKKFIRKINKQYMRTYGKYAKGTGDPSSDITQYMTLCVDKDRMVDNLKKVMKENVARTEQLKKEMGRWIKHCDVSPEFQKKVAAHTDKVMKNQQKRIKKFFADMGIDPATLPSPPVFNSVDGDDLIW